MSCGVSHVPAPFASRAIRAPPVAHDWVLHVLADLARFARLNHLPALANDLDQCLSTATRELGQPPP